MGTHQGKEAEGNIKFYLCALLLLQHRLNKYFNFIPGNLSEMEFLDISLTKYLSLLLHAIHSPFWRLLAEFKETHTLLWF